jgi:glycosyltransferase involved in cell wall biosynthesis
MTRPFVSVVVPVYNAKSTIKLCIEALLAQDYPRPQMEIIIVDNNSKDNTAQLVSAYPEAKLLYETAIQGSYAARNKGISDCVADPAWVTRLVESFADPKILGVGGQFKMAEPTNMIEKMLAETSSLQGNYQEESGLFLPPIFTGNTAYRKQVLDELGGFDSLLFTGGDVDLAWRLQHHHGNCVCYNPAAVTYYHHRTNLKEMKRQSRRYGIGEVYIDAMYHGYPGYPRRLRYHVVRIASQIWALAVYLRAFLYRLLMYPFRRDRYYLYKPVLLFIREAANINGKIQGLRATRFLRRSPGNPALRSW